MREILFRGKRVDNGEWVEGGIIPLDTECGYVFIAEPFLSASTLPVYEIIKHYTHLVIPETVGQYTGLCDKNGKRIFEGDIIHSVYANCRINEHIEKVVFHDGRFMAENVEGGFFAKISGKDSPKHLSQDTSVYMIECEVIGNIHDNSLEDFENGC